jgi:hypothetical protein
MNPKDLFIGRGAGRHIRDPLRQRGQSPVDCVEPSRPFRVSWGRDVRAKARIANQKWARIRHEPRLAR